MWGEKDLNSFYLCMKWSKNKTKSYRDSYKCEEMLNFIHGKRTDELNCKSYQQAKMMLSYDKTVEKYQFPSIYF